VNPKNFFAELKRRNVYKVAVAYAVLAWLLIQVATQVFPFFEIPSWGVRLIVLFIVIGFPIALTIEAVVAEDPAAARTIAEQWFYVAMCERDNFGVSRALAVVPPEGISAGNIWWPRAYFEAVAARARGEATVAHTAFTAARAEVEKTMREQPDYAQGLIALGLIDAGLGRKDDAIREGRRAVELVPISKDALAGTDLILNLAVIYAWTGEKDLALEQLAEAAHLPSSLDYGRVRLHPDWDPLRGDPRFEKIVASLAPK
jgi:tetratricopeptide (TPR) repeat protein